MPMLSERTNPDLTGYTPAEMPNQNSRPQAVSPSTDLQPGFSSFMRCPLPPFWSTSPDSLRMFYTGGIVPQNRLFNPTAPVIGATGTTTENVSVSSSGSSGSGGSSGGNTPSTSVLQTAIMTPNLQPNGQFVSSITMSRVFGLVNVSANAACRVQFYGSASAQSSDLYRPLDVAPPAGSTVNLISDVILDTAPYVWQFQDRLGSNQDNPRMPVAYITVTNIGSMVSSITATITYAPIVS
jgi:hypothetical protein